MLTKVLRAWHRFLYLYKINPKLAVKRLAQKIIAPIYRHDIGYITLRKQNDFSLKKYRDNKGTECIVLKEMELIRKWESKIPPLFSISKLKNHLTESSDSIVIFALRPDHSRSQKKIIGYRICQAGRFSGLGINGCISKNILYVCDTEVLPRYRGQRVNRIMMDATHEYCFQNGLDKIVGTIRAHNLPSLKHHVRWKGGGIICKIEKLLIFGGLFKRVTPWDTIKAIIEKS